MKTPPLTAEIVRDLQKLERTALPGPWEFSEADGNEMLVQCVGYDKIKPLLSLAQLSSKANEIKLCAALRNHAPVLLAIARKHFAK